MKNLSLQIFTQNQWQDVAVLSFDEQSYQLKDLSYNTEYVHHHFAQAGSAAISINMPVDFFNNKVNWLAILGDIIPAGASRRYWLESLDLKQATDEQKTYFLLEKACISPIGNLRIKEALPAPNEKIKTFSLQEVINRQHDFLEYANQRGAIVGGATGAGGEAPKLLLRRKGEQVWIDNQQRGEDAGDYCLVKFPRGNYSPIDCDILRDEQRIWLAPIYDFAPMRADPETIIRTMRWSNKGDKPQELGGEYNFEAIVESLAQWAEPQQLWQELQHLGAKLQDLKTRLAQRGVPNSILQHPAMGFDYLPEKLKKWRLI